MQWHKKVMAWNLKRWELYFLISVYVFSVAIRLLPKFYMDSHLPAFQGDIWYRICMAQYVYDNWMLPEPDIRYIPYGYVPMWYPPLSPIFFALLSKITTLDIPTVVTRVVPFFEALSPLSIYFLAKYLYHEKVAVYSTVILAATASYIYWTGIGDTQSFILFLIPLYILYFIKYARGEYNNKSLVVMGGILGVAFLFHLSYFVLLLSLVMITLSFFPEKNFRRPLFCLAVLIFISQAVAAWWWYPRDLYWWWIHGLTSSSGYYTPLKHFFEFGIVPAVLGGLGLAYVGIKRNHFLLLFLWMLPLFLETQNETILYAVGRIDLTWETLAKPLEGFRFYCFLAQPVSIAGGVFVWVLAKKFSKKIVFPVLIVLLLANLVANNIEVDLVNTGMKKREYDAAVWYRENTDDTALIVADYYRSQMIAGVCGGKALIGGLFPLRNVDYPYIKAPGQVQKDLYVLYTTADLEGALIIIEKYKITHIFYSENLERTGYFGASLQDGFGLPVYLDKFYTERFTVVYQDADIVIFAVLYQ